MKTARRPQAVMMSKRANVFYLERVRVFQRNECVVYGAMTEPGMQQLVNIPDKNSAFLLLGKGSSITDSAVRTLAESNVIVGFCGSGGSPLHAISDPIFLTPQDEYRPTEYMQSWVTHWMDDARRLSIAKSLQEQRIEWCKAEYPRVTDCPYPDDVAEEFRKRVTLASTANDVLSAEASYAKALYKAHANFYSMKFIRDPGSKADNARSPEERLANSFMDHGNYLAYGYAAVALHTLGISYAFPVLHGKTRRGALVFDVADLVKDWLVMPLAFKLATKGAKDNEFRASLIDFAQKRHVMDRLMNVLKAHCKD